MKRKHLPRKNFTHSNIPWPAHRRSRIPTNFAQDVPMSPHTPSKKATTREDFSAKRFSDRHRGRSGIFGAGGQPLSHPLDLFAEARHSRASVPILTANEFRSRVRLDVFAESLRRENSSRKPSVKLGKLRSMKPLPPGHGGPRELTSFRPPASPSTSARRRLSGGKTALPQVLVNAASTPRGSRADKRSSVAARETTGNSRALPNRRESLPPTECRLSRHPAPSRVHWKRGILLKAP